jgi:hypothetical protein
MVASQQYVSGQTLSRRWDAIRAGWPTLLVPLVGSFFIANMGQGKEALYAMTQYPHYLPALVAFVLCGIILYARFVAAVNRHYPFSVDAIHSTLPVPWAALFAACAMPLVFAVLYTWQEIAQMISNDANQYWSGLFVCVAAMTVLFAAHRIAANRFMVVIQTHSSRFLVFNRYWRLGELTLVTFLFATALAVWFFPGCATFVGPVPVFTIGMTVWAVVGNLFVSIIARRDWMPSPAFALILVICAIAYVVPRFGSGHYMVATILRAPCSGCNKTPPLVSDVAQKWLAERAGKGMPVTAIVVTADGGGIRAALETAAVLAQLDDDSNGEFFHNIYALSGVSGGAIGLATYVAAHTVQSRDNNKPEVGSVEQVLTADHFSPLLAGLLLRDIPDTLVPFSLIRSSFIPDRARLFEKSLSEGWPGADEMQKGIEQAVADTVPPGHAPPILLLNTTLANAGTVETVSNVTFPDIKGVETLCNVLGRLSATKTISLATAAHLSARFPIVDSPGEITVPENTPAKGECNQDVRTRLYYVDGGYADNSGAAAVLHAVEALKAARDDDARFQHVDLRVLVIHIYSSTDDPQERKKIETIGDDVRVMDDLQVPVQAISSVRYELGLEPLKALCERVRQINNPFPDRAMRSTDACRQLGSGQARRSASDHGVATRLLDNSSCLLWLNAALYVSDLNNDPAYVPLGWMLGPKAHYVEEQSRSIARSEIEPLLISRGSFDASAIGNRAGCTRTAAHEASTP